MRLAKMILLAEGGFLPDLVALITAVAGVIAGIVSMFKYMDERRKRKAAERNLEEILMQVRGLLKGTDEAGEEQATSQYCQKLDDILAHLRTSHALEKNENG